MEEKKEQLRLTKYWKENKLYPEDKPKKRGRKKNNV